MKDKKLAWFFIHGFILLMMGVRLVDGATTRWVYRYARSGAGADQANAVIYGGDGYIYAAGYSTASAGRDWCVVSLTTSGDTNWVRNFNRSGTGADEAKALVYGSDGNLYVAGYTYNGANADFTVISYTTAGATRWSYYYNGSGSGADQTNSVVYGADGNVYATGYCTATNQDFCVISLGTAAGDTNWVRVYNGPGNASDEAKAIIYGSDGYLYACGYAYRSAGNGNDFTVMKISTAGARSWAYLYNGPGNGSDIANAIVQGGSDSIYIAGYSLTSGTDDAFTVIGLKQTAGANGETLWVRRYDEAANASDQACAIVYGSDGKIYATGYTTPSGTNIDFTTRCYSKAGATNWTNTYNGSASQADLAYALVYGSDNNVYAAGRFANTNYDMGVISYKTTSSRAAGDTNWTYSYNGTGNSTDEALAITYGTDGNLYVAGYSWGSGTSRDFLVLSLSTPTLATVSDFNAYDIKGKVMLEWQTASEVGTIGFHLLRQDAKTGEYRRVNDKLLPGLIHSPQGGVYRYFDETAVPGQRHTYKLIEVEACGSTNAYGPYTVTPTRKAEEVSSESNLSVYVKQPHQTFVPKEIFEKPISSTNRHCEEFALSERRSNLKIVDCHALRARNGKKSLEAKRIGNNLKITVDADGLYYLSAEGIANVFGMPVAKVSRLIWDNNLMLSNQGQKVAYTNSQTGSGMYFYGQKTSSIYTNENVYWLTRGRGLRMEVTSGIGPDPTSGEETFSDAVHFEDNNYALTSLFSDPNRDYWFWDYVIAGDPQCSTKTFDFNVYGVAGNANNATLVLNLQGVTNTEANPDHHVKVLLNGTEIGESQWDSVTSNIVTISFTQSLLNEGENTLAVTGLLNSGVEYSIFYVNYFDINYERLYQAVDNNLFCEGNNHPVVTVAGFTNSSIYLFELINPLRPRLIRATTIDNIGTNYRLSFSPASEASYLALTPDVVSTPVSVIADMPSKLRSPYNVADYVMIVPGEFKPTIQTLAAYREAQGYRVMVIDLEDIMDEFNYGISSPEAIKRFLVYAYNNWRSEPKYVLLVGNGTYDYKDYLGYGDNSMPPLLYGTDYGLFASDNLMVDVTSDGLADMAIGRLPVITQTELETMISKIIAYESASGAWLSNILMLADNPDQGGDFTFDSDDLAGLIPNYYNVERIYLEEHSIEDARGMLLAGINEGALLMNYFGHSGLDRLTQEGLLMTSDVDSLSNGECLPIMTAMSCVVGRYEIPGYDCLSEALVLKNNGGAIATWAPTGLCLNADSKILDQGFFEAAFGQYEQTLGEMVLNGLAAYARTRSELYVLYVYNLIGDPAMEMR